MAVHFTKAGAERHPFLPILCSDRNPARYGGEFATERKRPLPPEGIDHSLRTLVQFLQDLLPFTTQ
jgi:hypothetical protein